MLDQYKRALIDLTIKIHSDPSHLPLRTDRSWRWWFAEPARLSFSAGGQRRVRSGRKTWEASKWKPLAWHHMSDIPDECHENHRLTLRVSLWKFYALEIELNLPSWAFLKECFSKCCFGSDEWFFKTNVETNNQSRIFPMLFKHLDLNWRYLLC